MRRLYRIAGLDHDYTTLENVRVAKLLIHVRDVGISSILLVYMLP